MIDICEIILDAFLTTFVVPQRLVVQKGARAYHHLPSSHLRHILAWTDIKLYGIKFVSNQKFLHRVRVTRGETKSFFHKNPWSGSVPGRRPQFGIEGKLKFRNKELRKHLSRPPQFSATLMPITNDDQQNPETIDAQNSETAWTP